MLFSLIIPIQHFGSLCICIVNILGVTSLNKLVSTLWFSLKSVLSSIRNLFERVVDDNVRPGDKQTVNACMKPVCNYDPALGIILLARSAVRKVKSSI